MGTKRSYIKDIIKVCVSFVYFVVVSVYSYLKSQILQKKASSLVVLYYHGVGADERRTFSRQLDQLRKFSQVVPSGYVATGGEVGLLTAVTFDDAFSNLLRNAIPELSMRSMPATVFVPVGLIGEEPSWDMSAENREIADIVMGKVELMQLLAWGFTLGSHTLSHPRLSSLSDSEVRRELQVSREILQADYGVSISEIAFPYGDYDQRTLEICREIGYCFAFSIQPALIDPSNISLLRGRVSVSPSDSRLVFYLKCHGAYSWVSQVSRIKNKFRDLGRKG